MNKILPFALLLLVPACGGAPARTDTSSTTSVVRGTEGGEMRRTSTETREVGRDGAQSTESTETVTTSVPAPN